MSGPRPPDHTVDLTPLAWLSIGTALATMALKAVAYLLTGSVGLLSDALESSVNLVAAVGALVALRVAARPADDSHAFGHAKAEYFSAGAEGLMILVAAATIAWTAVGRLLDPRALTDVGIGLVVSSVAAATNLVVAGVLLRAGRRHRSITLEADGRHLLTDVWTSAGVLVGVALVAVTGWEPLDPIVALAVAANIVVAGAGLLRRSVGGLMDAALGPEDLAAVESVLARHRTEAVRFHGLRTRRAGRRSFMTVHVLVPGAWSVQRAHDLLESLESDLRAAVPGLDVVGHVEPLEDPRSFDDSEVDRAPAPPGGDGAPAGG